MSESGNFFLTMQDDGNLVIYNTVESEPKPIWSSKTSGPIASYFLVMEEDGNLRVYPGVSTNKLGSHAPY